MKIVVHHYRQTQFSRLTTGVKAEGEVDTHPETTNRPHGREF